MQGVRNKGRESNRGTGEEERVESRDEERKEACGVKKQISFSPE